MRRKNSPWLGMGIVAAVVITAGSWLMLAMPSSVTAIEVTESPAFAASGSKTCITCHGTEKITGIFHTKHAAGADPRTPMGMFQCETCHGGSQAHQQDPKTNPFPPITYRSGGLPVSKQNAVCLQCHDSASRVNWPHSAHERAGTRCVDCHKLHRNDDPILRPLSQTDICISCHKEQRMDLQKPSTHPIAAGQMRCSECHQVHGSHTDKLIAAPTINQSCYACHAEKRGPFLWEHAPAREDCTTCHTPHGSVHPSLLHARAPFLCQQCHSMAGHPSIEVDAGSLAQGDFRNRFVLAKGCLNCHSQIHGSNHPSGVKFNR